MDAPGDPEETGGYGFFTNAEGKILAGYGPQQNPGPPFWSHYVSVADVDDTAGRVAIIEMGADEPA